MYLLTALLYKVFFAYTPAGKYWTAYTLTITAAALLG
jgi:hypothetical protein